jgi:hypothetical protein
VNPEKYKHKTKKPNERDYKTVYLYKEGVLVEKLTEPESIEKYGVYINTDYEKWGFGACEKHFDTHSFDIAYKEYFDKEYEMWYNFLEDFTNYLGVNQHVLHEDLWEMIKLVTPEIEDFNVNGTDSVAINGINLRYDKLIQMGDMFKRLIRN